MTVPRLFRLFWAHVRCQGYLLVKGTWRCETCTILYGQGNKQVLFYVSDRQGRAVRFYWDEIFPWHISEATRADAVNQLLYGVGFIKGPVLVSALAPVLQKEAAAAAATSLASVARAKVKTGLKAQHYVQKHKT